MATLLLTLSPQRILIGGGVLQHRPGLLAAIRRKTASLLAGYLDPIDEASLAAIILSPGLGDQAGPLGTIALARRKFLVFAPRAPIAKGDVMRAGPPVDQPPP